MTEWQKITWAILLAIPLMFSPVRSYAEGPWKAQIVDAETGKPVEGVVVVAVWERYMRGLGTHGAAGGYGASEEVVTDKQGHFTIGARSSWTFNPFVYLRGPQFYIFKAGYGRWRFKGETEWVKLEAYFGRKALDEARARFATGAGVVIELPPLKTRKERLEFYQGGSGPWTPPGNVPPAEIKQWKAAESAERAFLGFR